VGHDHEPVLLVIHPEPDRKGIQNKKMEIRKTSEKTCSDPSKSNEGVAAKYCTSWEEVRVG
jgi:hypothetical protein